MAYNACVRHGISPRDETVAPRRTWKTKLSPSFYFLVDESTGLPVQPALDFFASKFLTRNASNSLKFAEETRKAYAYDVADFHHFLDSRKVPVERITTTLISDFFDTFNALPSPATNRPYSRDTKIRHRNSVLGFIKFAYDAGYLATSFNIERAWSESSICDHFNAEEERRPNSPIDRVVRAPDPRLLNLMMDSLGSAAVEEGREGQIVVKKLQNPDRLMGELALQCGLRRSEVISLQCVQIDRLVLYRRRPLGDIPVAVRGKGNKTREVPMPVWLLSAVRRYIETTRRQIVNRALETDETYEEPSNIFLSDTEKAGVIGRPITPRQLNRIFAKARSGLLRRLESASQEAHLVKLLCNARLTYHSLRHAFAIVTYHARKVNGDPDPTKYVQTVLGHASRETTERIYLRASHVLEVELSELMEAEIRGYVHG